MVENSLYLFITLSKIKIICIINIYLQLFQLKKIISFFSILFKTRTHVVQKLFIRNSKNDKLLLYESDLIDNFCSLA